MAVEKMLMGLFRDEDRAVQAIEALKKTTWKLARVYSPIPSHHIDKVMGSPKSKVGWFTLCGGIIGFFTGIALAAFTATRWSLIVSGKPIVAWVPFFVVGFEFTVLFAVFGNIIGLITLTGLPKYGNIKGHDPRCSGDRFGVVATCAEEETDGLTAFFEEQGAQVKEMAVSTE